MILSTVNLIKSKNITNNNITSQSFTDFILGKIREEQDVKDKRQLGPAPFPTKQQKSKKPRDVFTFDNVVPALPKRSPVPIERELSKSSVSEVYVSIETSDGYFLTINTEAQGPRRVYLEDTAFPTHQTCTFEQVVLETNTNENRTLIAFKSVEQSQGALYLTITDDKQLDIKKFDKEPSLEKLDERAFVMHKVGDTNALLQPYNHKGFYLHHLDQELNVRRLEINWRPPEEYFFQVSINDLYEKEIIEAFKSPKNVDNYVESNFTLGREKRNINLVTAPTRIPIKPVISEKPSLWLGCFGMKSRKIANVPKKDKRNR